jgi:hypothetical protein
MWRGAQCAIFHQETTRATLSGGVNSAQIKQDSPRLAGTGSQSDGGTRQGNTAKPYRQEKSK